MQVRGEKFIFTVNLGPLEIRDQGFRSQDSGLSKVFQAEFDFSC